MAAGSDEPSSPSNQQPYDQDDYDQNSNLINVSHGIAARPIRTIIAIDEVGGSAPALRQSILGKDKEQKPQRSRWGRGRGFCLTTDSLTSCEVETTVELMTVGLAELVNARIERWNSAATSYSREATRRGGHVLKIGPPFGALVRGRIPRPSAKDAAHNPTT